MNERKQEPVLCQAFECFRFDSVAAGGRFPLESLSHYFSEILLVRSGVCRIIRGAHTHILSPGELIHIAPFVPHSIASADGNPVAYDVVKFSATRLKELAPYLSDLRTLSSESAQVRLPIQMSAEEVRARHLDRIIEECLVQNQRHDMMSDLHIRSLIYLLVCGIARFWVDKREDFSELLSRPHSPIVDIPAYIEQHISEPLKVEDLAAHCSLSYPWFAKQFHDYFGISCKQCIEQLRIEAVEQYLTYSEMDLPAISNRTGYTDCSHLVRDFRRMNGMTPGQYRSMMKMQGRAPSARFSGESVPNRPPKG